MRDLGVFAFGAGGGGARKTGVLMEGFGRRCEAQHWGGLRGRPGLVQRCDSLRHRFHGRTGLVDSLRIQFFQREEKE
ncbi:hypothetical protein L484_000131 [Morus notabilis]|uniref:Uncharacterized protein n=1 Tax=Morus notabilis TaxID=981085 RepID=W9SP50_9ROSA|nr:hypothetical protein L484_000131 [Morus notabilis]